MKQRFARLCVCALSLSMAVSCAESVSPPVQPPLGPLAEEIYGIFCDRFGANTFREDLTGASFYGVCHRVNGVFANEVDASKLPVLTEAAVDASGAPVSLAAQQEHRAKRTMAMRRLAVRRADIIEAVGAVASEDLVDLKNIGTPGPGSCDLLARRASLASELGEMLQRMGPVYQDGSLQGMISGIDPVLAAFSKSPAAIDGWRAIRGRAGYRPAEDTFSGARAVLADPQLFDSLGELLRAVGPHVEPTDIRSPEASGHQALLALMGALRAELSNLVSKEQSHVATSFDLAGKWAPTRARTGLEFAVALMGTEGDAFELGTKARYLVRRDARGLPWVRGTGVGIAAPFADADNDLRADIDDVGAFVGKDLPTPFADLGTDPTTPRDARGVATVSGSPAFETYNISKTWGAASLPELNGVFSAPGNAWAKFARATPIVLGPRAASSRIYADGSRVEYQGYQASRAPLMDLTWAMTHAASLPETERLLSVLSEILEKHPESVARLVKAVVQAKELANADTVGVYPENATFWDDMLKLVGDIADVPGLLENVVVNAADQRLVVSMQAFGKLMLNRDNFDYDRGNLNGLARNLSVSGSASPALAVDRSKPDTGDNRSIFQHFAQMVAEMDGVALCTKDGATAHIRGLPIVNTFELPLSGTYRECEVIKVDNVAHFYLQALVGSPKAAFNMRPPLMNTGVAPGTVDMLQRSSGILGFWAPVDSTVLTPKPAFIHRLGFFDLKSDSFTEGSGPNHITNKFLRDLLPDNIGTNLCESRDIPDPCATQSCHGDDVRPDKMVRGLRNCKAGEWLRDRHPYTVFALESGGLLDALVPLVKPFVDAGREDLLVRLLSTMSKHWQSGAGTAAECRMRGGASCSKAGLSSYEPLLGGMVAGDLVPAVVAFAMQADSTRIKQCTATNAAGRCTAVSSAEPSGLDVLAAAARAISSPKASTTRGLADRRGSTAVTWKDGSAGYHVTPLTLAVDALVKIDAGYAAAGAEGAQRQKEWREARSSIVDQMLRTEGDGLATRFASVRLAPVVSATLRAVRGEAAARCPKSFVPPYAPCAWLQTELNASLEDLVAGPTLAAGVDVVEAATKSPSAVAGLSRMLAAMTDPGHVDDRVLPLAQSTLDALGAAQDTRAIRALLPIVTLALDPKAQPQPVDATISLLGRVGLSPTDNNGAQRCDWSIDPNRALPQALTKAMTPLEKGAHQGATPLELLADAIADVNRASQDPLPAPTQADYVAITEALRHFLTSKENGMSQIIATIEKALGQ